MSYLFYLSIGYFVGLAMVIIANFMEGRAYKNEIKYLREKNEDILNRFMARSFQDYASGRRVLNPPVTDVELAEEALGMTAEDKERADRLSVD